LLEVELARKTTASYVMRRYSIIAFRVEKYFIKISLATDTI